ncbi:MAG: hypothetical protein AB7T06_20280 [Kofleriaceae bacterium]
MSLALSCGDDGPPVCPTGNCTLPGSTVVKFKFNNYPDVGFDSDTCSELSVAMVRVEVIGVEDPTGYDIREVQCSEGQATFSDLQVQNYNVAVTPLDVDGNPLIKANAEGRGTVAAAGPGARNEVTVTVQYESWARSYTGQFLFKLTWLGASCTPTGTTTVTKHAVTLMVNGSVVAQRTTNPADQPLDGSVDIPCVPSTGMPLTVANVPWGPATLHVIGKNDANEVLGDHTFDTFVGAGMFNPTLTFDTPADAGVPSDI